MTDDKTNSRIIFRPTKEQYDRVIKFYMNSGQYKTISELMRRILTLGLDKLESEVDEKND